MAEVFERYAVYFVPETGSGLWQTGCRWLGRNPDDGRDAWPDFPEEAAAAGLSREAWETVTESPRRYGFHATLKPPFTLAEKCDLADLDVALAHFAARRRRVEGPSLRVAPLGDFIALRPESDDSVLTDLAADCVRVFDSFRRPPSTAELARRRSDGLTARQDALLEAWGYPYVFEEFRFHMTLTGPIEVTVMDRLIPCLEEMFSPALKDPISVSGIALFREREPGAPFQIVRRYQFDGG